MTMTVSYCCMVRKEMLLLYYNILHVNLCCTVLCDQYVSHDPTVPILSRQCASNSACLDPFVNFTMHTVTMHMRCSVPF